jgi:hypothetical protein
LPTDKLVSLQSVERLTSDIGRKFRRGEQKRYINNFFFLQPARVVVASRALDDQLGFAQSIEDLAVEQLIAKAGVEALDVAVLPRAAPLDVGGLALLPAAAGCTIPRPARACRAGGCLWGPSAPHVARSLDPLVVDYPARLAQELGDLAIAIAAVVRASSIISAVRRWSSSRPRGTLRCVAARAPNRRDARRHAAALGPAQCRHGDARGLEVPPSRLLQNELIQREIGNCLAQPAVSRAQGPSGASRMGTPKA